MDGCSFNCKIETGWNCTGGGEFTPDICVDNNPIRYKIIDQNVPNLYQENLDANSQYKFKIWFSKQFVLPPGKSLKEYINITIPGRPDVPIAINSVRLSSSPSLRNL